MPRAPHMMPVRSVQPDHRAIMHATHAAGGAAAPQPQPAQLTRGAWMHMARDHEQLARPAARRGEFSYRATLVDDLAIPASTLTIDSPVQIKGQLAFSVITDAGNSFYARAEDNYVLNATIVLPHSDDDRAGCRNFTRYVNDEGDALAGSFLLLMRGFCLFSEKFAWASMIPGLLGVLLIGNDDSFFTAAIYSEFTVPAVYIPADNGRPLREYLNTRRNLTIQTTRHPEIPLPPEVSCSRPCILEPIRASLIGTGPLVDPAERAALLAIGSGFVWDPLQPLYLPSWDAFRANPAADPCYPRGLVGVYCERGRIVSINIADFNLAGDFASIQPGQLDALSGLHYISIASNRLSGVIPDAFCALRGLIAISADGNAFTHLPECIGGTTEPDSIGLPQLAFFSFKSNRLRNLPVSLSNTTRTLRCLLLSSNEIQAAFPIDILRTGSSLERLEAYGNTGLTLDFAANPDITFSGLINAFSILLRDCGLRGPLPVGAFDDMPLLSQLDLRDNQLGPGPLPSFVGCTGLSSLILSNNAFTGGIPESWAQYLDNLKDLYVDRNQLTQPMDFLQLLPALRTVYASFNRIASVIGESGPDVGLTVWSMSSQTLQELYLDHNALTGSWSAGLIPSGLLKLSVAYNQLDQLPTDLWSTLIIPYVDFSYCNIGGSLPAISPPLTSDPITGTRALERLKLEGNPALRAWPLPAWLQQSASEYVLDTSGGPFVCLKLQTSSASVEISVDPSFTGYIGCLCSTGTFGVPPKCFKLPESAALMPFQPPTSSEVGADFANVIETAQSSNVTTGPDFVASSEMAFGAINSAPGDRSAHRSSSFFRATARAGRLLQSSEAGLTAHAYPSHPLGWTDAWYGSDRFTSGMSTRWTVDLRGMYAKQTDLDAAAAQQQAAGSQEPTESIPPAEVQMLNRTALGAAATLDSTGAIILTTSGTVLQPVRMLTIRMHVSLSTFTSNCFLSLFAGDADLRQTRVWALSGSDRTTLDALPRSTSFTSTAAYQAAYGPSLALLQPPVAIAEVQVFSPIGTVDFSTRNPNGTHFVSSYSASFVCPPGYEVSEDTTECAIPRLGNTRSALVVGLIVAAVLCLLVFLWLLWERYQRQQVHRTLLQKDRRGSIFARKSAAQPAERPSDIDLEHETERLYLSLRSQEHRSLLKELLFELWTLVSSMVSAVLNWIVVGQVLAAGTNELSSESVAYITIVVISTFAFGAIAVSRVFVLMALRAQMQQVMRKGHLGNEASGAFVPGASWQTMSEKQARFDMDLLDRRLARHGMTAISLGLNAVPFIALNLYSLYQRDSLHGSANLTLMLSLLFNILLLGSKLQELKEYPMHRIQRTQMRIRLIELEKAKLHEQQHPENGLAVDPLPKAQKSACDREQPQQPSPPVNDTDGAAGVELSEIQTGNSTIAHHDADD